MHALFKMTRDLLFFTFLLLVVRCSVAESLFGDASDTNKSNWVCDLGRTTGSCYNNKDCVLYKTFRIKYIKVYACDELCVRGQACIALEDGWIKKTPAMAARPTIKWLDTSP